MNHDCGLIHYQLLDRKPHTSLHEPPGRCVHVSACVWACVAEARVSCYMDACHHPLALCVGYHKAPRPLLKIIYTNDIPGLARRHTVSCTEPAPYCHGCGGTVCSVDNSTFSLAGTDPVALSSGLTEQCQVGYKY